MAWLPYTLLTATETATGSLNAGDVVQLISTALNLGVLGIVFWLFIQGRLHTDSEVNRLSGENARLIAEKTHVEEQRDDALRVARDDIAPLLTTFTATTSALIPLLQELVRQQESERGRRPPGRNPR